MAEYLAVLRRRKWLFLVAVVLTTGSAIFFASREPKRYEAFSQVLVNPDATLRVGAGSSASTVQARFDATQAQLAHTPEVAKIVVQRAGVPGVTAGALIANSSISADSSSNILNFAVTNKSQVDAKKLVNNYANAFVTFGTEVNNRAIQLAVSQATTEINRLTKQIDAAKKLGNVPAGLRQELDGLVRKRSQYQQELIGAATGARVARYAQGAKQTQPNVQRDAGLGVFLGLVLGLVLAFGREAFDTRVRASGEIAAVTGLKLLARIPTPAGSLRAANQLIMLSNPKDVHSEPYRKLLVAIDFANLSVRARTVMITSAVEQEGKSTTVANLAVAMARAGRRVILVDLDLRRPMTAKFFGLEGRPGLTDVALGHVSMDDALAPIVIGDAPETTAVTNGSGGPRAIGTLQVLSAGAVPPDAAEFVGAQVVADMLGVLADRADVVLIDAPPLIPVADAVILSGRVDSLVVVARAELLKRPTLGELRRLLDDCPAPVFGFILTGAEVEGGYGDYRYGYSPPSTQSAAPPVTQPR